MKTERTARPRGRVVALALAFVGALFGALDGAAAGWAAPARDAAFWQAIVDDDYRLPSDESPHALVEELLALLGATDPVLRDRYGYEIFAAWVYRDALLSPAELESVRRRLCADASGGLGEPAGDPTLRRSFALLNLSVLAALDLKAPFMTDTSFEDTLAVALDSLARERDLRGYVDGRGWVHATAHGADLLKFLGRSPRLTPAGQRRIVDGVQHRLRSAEQVYVWGEDVRLAAAVLSVLRRPDAIVDVLRPWLAALEDENRSLWAGEFDPRAYAAVRAQVNTLAQLATLLGRSEVTAAQEHYAGQVQATLAATAL